LAKGDYVRVSKRDVAELLRVTSEAKDILNHNNKEAQ